VRTTALVWGGGGGEHTACAMNRLVLVPYLQVRESLSLRVRQRNAQRHTMKYLSRPHSRVVLHVKHVPGAHEVERVLAEGGTTPLETGETDHAILTVAEDLVEDGTDDLVVRLRHTEADAAV